MFESKANKKKLDKYGMTWDQYDRLFEYQGGRCAICLKPESTVGPNLAIDHNHATGRVRGLLCAQCNMGLGNLQDSPDILRTAIEYLKQDKRYDGIITYLENREYFDSKINE